MERKKTDVICNTLRPLLFILLIGFLPSKSSAQKRIQDTILNLPAVTIKAYLSAQNPFRVTGSISTIDTLTIHRNTSRDFLPVVNGVAGVKMEERSPGSYRLSIRGSLLRSPFGVRNIKVYYDAIPLTDASGNTYLNLLDMGGIYDMTFLKGPDGSLFGANSGGVMLIRPRGMSTRPTGSELNASIGSFRHILQQASTDLQLNPSYRFSISQAYEESKGYREQSGLSRRFIQTSQRWHYAKQSELRFIGVYSDLRYQTPGGLTKEQYHLDPKQARPRVGDTPGAVEQQTRIENKTFWGGLVHEVTFAERFKHVATVFGSLTDFKNPFITNYEIRDEKNLGFRSWIEYKNSDAENWNWNIHAGMEWQHGWNKLNNYDNHFGQQGAPQVEDRIRNNQYFYFIRWSADWKKRLLLEVSNSVNRYAYAYRRMFPTDAGTFENLHSKPAWMPRAAASYLFTPRLNGRVSVSRGFAPPTLAEIRASDKQFNTDLDAEKGWNYEAGLRWQNTAWEADVAFFKFRMNNAIIRQVNAQDAEYFDNVGGVDQKGVEAHIRVQLLQRPTGLIQNILLDHASTFSHFRFEHYRSDGSDWSGNRVTGIPDVSSNSVLTLNFNRAISVHIRHFYSAKTPLNDSNTAYADPYHLLQAKAAVRIRLYNRLQARVWVAMDNIGNASYSLGNDINAYGGRFYNPAPDRNVSLGVQLKLF